MLSGLDSTGEVGARPVGRLGHAAARWTAMWAAHEGGKLGRLGFGQIGQRK
jgi:hypothetical protein